MKLKEGLIISIAATLLSHYVHAAETVTGTVAETIDVGTYVYVRLKEDDAWLASSPLEVRVGDHVEFVGGALMKDFYSPKLDRTFPDILFVSGLNVVEAVQGADHHAGVVAGGPHGEVTEPSIAPPEPGEISPPEGGMTILEIVAARESMEGQQVILRARVMKVSMNILGKNWITLQDGTGTAPADRLVATTAGVVEPGEVITVRGRIKSDVDIGSGYRYEMLLEDATIVR
jgi:hypothetical protein